MKLATLCYVQTENKTLMMYRNRKPNDTHKGKWNGLGGKFEAGETPEQCAIREVKEECGLDVHHLILKGFITFPLFDGVDDWYVFVFVIDKFTGMLSDCAEGELSWIDNKDLLNLNLWEGDRIFLPWLNEEKFFSGEFVYEDKSLKSWSVNKY